MKLLYGESLRDRIREICGQARKKVWIASPYIGDWPSVIRILGNIIKRDIDIRLLTDSYEIGLVGKETIQILMKSGKVKDLSGLHAKMYISDNNVIIASANLTKTAFTRRYEVGIEILEKPLIKEVRNLFNRWWDDKAAPFDKKWYRHIRKGGDQRDSDRKLPLLWDLCPSPFDSSPITKKHFILLRRNFSTIEDKKMKIKEEIHEPILKPIGESIQSYLKEKGIQVYIHKQSMSRNKYSENLRGNYIALGPKPNAYQPYRQISFGLGSRDKFNFQIHFGLEPGKEDRPSLVKFIEKRPKDFIAICKRLGREEYLYDRDIPMKDLELQKIVDILRKKNKFGIIKRYPFNKYHKVFSQPEKFLREIKRQVDLLLPVYKAATS